VFAQLKPITV